MPPIAIFGVVVVVALVLVIVLFITTRLRPSPPQRLPPSTQAMIADAKLDAGERPSTVTAEQIEEMVKLKLDQFPDLADVKLDFGSMPDLTIDIWVDAAQYDDVEDIPDERIRQAIKEAADEFNA